MIITDLYETNLRISNGNYNPSLNTNLTLIVKLVDFNKNGVANKEVTVTVDRGYITGSNGVDNITYNNTTTKTTTNRTDGNGEVSVSYTASETGLITFSCNNSKLTLFVKEVKTGWKTFINNEAFTGWYNDDLVTLSVHVANTTVPRYSWTEWGTIVIPASNPDLRPHGTLVQPTNHINTFIMINSESQKVARTTSGDARSGAVVNGMLIWKRR